MRVKTDSLDVIRDGEGVDAVARRARDEGRFAIDFEFLWEKTYAPMACLAQVAVGDAVYLIDPIEGAPLEPLGELVADPGVLTIMHAPSADLTLLHLHLGVRPANLHDVQLMAGFVGLGAGQGLSALLERVLKVRLDKGEQYTDWSRRPLTGKQLRYAAADVEHLGELHDRLLARAESQGRAEWVMEEHARRYGPDARLSQAPDEAWRKVKGQGKLPPADRAVLRRLAAWREHTAAERDRPTQWICPDRTLLEIARRKPADAGTLSRERGLPERMRNDDIEGILQAVRDGVDDPPLTLPAPPRSEIVQRLETLGPLGQVLIAHRAASVNLAPTLLATRDDVEGYLATVLGDEDASSPLASGWRHELAGEALAALANGTLALAAGASRPYLREITVD